MTTPAIRLLKQSVLESKIIAVVNKENKCLIEKNSNIYYIIVKTSRWQTIKEIRKISPEIVILFRTTFFNSFATFLSKPKYSIGLDEEFSKLFLKKVLPKDISRPYRAECVLLVEDVVEHFLGKKCVPYDLKTLDFFYKMDTETTNYVIKKLETMGLYGEKKYIVISPVASRKTKMLSLQQYLRLIDLLLQTFPSKYFIILVGSKNDKPFVEQLLNQTKQEIKEPTRVISLCGEFSLNQLAYLLTLAEIFISPDTGPAFIAQAVMSKHQKIVIYFTSTLPEKYGPYPENVKVVYKPIFCSPCYKNNCYNNSYKCISQVTAQDIVAQLGN